MFSKRKFKDTGYLTEVNPQLASGSFFIVKLDKRFQPYNDCKIINLNSDNDCEVEVNQHSTQIIPKGNEIQINQPIIKHLKITNIGPGTISASEIRVFYRNDGFQGREIINKGTSYLNIGLNALRLLK